MHPLDTTKTETENEKRLQRRDTKKNKKTKAPNSDYHKDEPPVAARQVEVARDYLKRAARIDELKVHPPGSDGKMVAALKRYNGGRVLVHTRARPYLLSRH